MWDEIIKRWIDLFFCWLPGDEKAQEHAPGATAQDADHVPEKGVDDETEAARKVLRDDLTVIKGIGPVVQEKLRSLGIRTFRDLAAADAETLTEQLKGGQPISRARVRGWTEAARDQAGARD